MDEVFPGDLHAGLTELVLPSDPCDLGEDITLRRTYAHLMAHSILAFARPDPGSPHPGPWKSAKHALAFDITTEIHIPQRHTDRIGIARAIVFLIRLYINPAVTVVMFANHPFADLKDLPDKECITIPLEIWPRHFALSVEFGEAGAAQIETVKQRWRTTHALLKESPEFALAVDAIDSGQFIQNSALTLVSLWGALEALFSPSTTELRFRVSALIAAFLEPPGARRLSLQRDIARLYDKRSSAAHGKPEHNADDLLDTFDLLRRVLMLIIDRAKVPTKDELDGLLFGCGPDADSAPRND
jgi:hypothetical protein